MCIRDRITVDSTLGFPESGTIFSGENNITYTSKSINQFFGCSGITTDIEKSSLVLSNNTYYAYENGDISREVKIRLLGVISDIETSAYASEGDIISIKNIGDKIINPEIKTHKEVFANSWIYNTATRYQVSSFGSNYILESDIDRSSLKVGDRIELLERGTEILVQEFDTPTVLQIVSNNTIQIDGSFATIAGKKYDLRRKINTASSSGVPIELSLIHI